MSCGRCADYSTRVCRLRSCCERARYVVHEPGLYPNNRACGRRAGVELKAHPHMLRHACGYALANQRHDTSTIRGWLGRRSITSIAVYTALASNRFKDFWPE